MSLIFKKMMKGAIFLILVTILIQTELNAQLAHEAHKFKPAIDGEWWNLTGNPDLGNLTSSEQQPVDFGIWQAADGTWQLWSCIRRTKELGKTRLFYGWEGKLLTDTSWTPAGIKMKANPLVGETAGGLQAPYTFREGNIWYMFYGDWNSICIATSTNGKVFESVVQQNSSRVTAIFNEGAGTHSRDAMVIKDGSTYYCYYTAGTGYSDDGADNETGAIYCRTSNDKKHWNNSIIVSKGGRTGNSQIAHECPFVVKIDGYFYLFRTQSYGMNNISTVYRSADPLNFGIGTDDGYFITDLPVAAPELVNYKGQWYIIALNPELNGIRAARLKWIAE